jgi:hypothetical protein
MVLETVIAIVGALGLGALLTWWLRRRSEILADFLQHAGGATQALAYAAANRGDPGAFDNAKWLAGELAPFLAQVRSSVRRLGSSAADWVNALDTGVATLEADGDPTAALESARKAQREFERKAAFAGFGR